ncbi:MAG: ATP-binding cassette domain-containing protein [Proteobacteria bacterium]|nr:ATP-binding cassette domain-containing protein [Pseudomonadota bacterium]
MDTAKSPEFNQPVDIEIQVEGLHKAFGDHQVLQGVDLEIRRGGVVAIVGGSGCGKTVLMDHILGQLVPDAGRVRVADYTRDEAPLVDIANLHEMELNAIHTHWGVVFQKNALFSGTVYDNIELWLKEVKELDDKEIEQIALDVLKAVALPTDAKFMHTDIESLSGGMAKRLAIARALSMDPKVIIYDEPTTGLDPTSATQVQDLVLATHFKRGVDNPNRTTVIITHDKDLLSRLHPQIVMLHNGRVSFDGAFAEFEDSPSPIIRPYFDLMPALHMRDPLI